MDPDGVGWHGAGAVVTVNGRWSNALAVPGKGGRVCRGARAAHLLCSCVVRRGAGGRMPSHGPHGTIPSGANSARWRTFRRADDQNAHWSTPLGDVTGPIDSLAHQSCMSYKTFLPSSSSVVFSLLVALIMDTLPSLLSSLPPPQPPPILPSPPLYCDDLLKSRTGNIFPKVFFLFFF